MFRRLGFVVSEARDLCLNRQVMKSTFGVFGRRHVVATGVLMLLAGCSRCAGTAEPERRAPEAGLDPPAAEGATAANLMSDARGEVIASWLEPGPRGDA